MTFPAGVLASDAITIGDALENTARAAGDKPVDESDAAAIQAAELRASGFAHADGVTVVAQASADLNAGAMGVEDKIKLGEALVVSNK